MSRRPFWGWWKALPPGVYPVVVADRGFHRASFIAFLQRYGLQYVVGVKKGSCLTEADGYQWKLGCEDLKPGQLRFVCGVVRYGLYHDRPRDLTINVALCWRVPKSKARDPRRGQPSEPWYLATSLESPNSAVSWYWQRGWIEQSFKDAKSRFHLDEVRVGCPQRLGRLLMALTIALSWLGLMGLPESGVLPRGLGASVSAWGRASFISLALSLLEELSGSAAVLPTPTTAHGVGGYASERGHP